MGRRKTKKIKQSKSSLALKNRNKIDREFHCHRCQHDKSVSIKIDMRSAIGFLRCRICGADFSTRITSLDEPIDVYTAWMDECRERDRQDSMREQTKPAKQDQKSPQLTYEKETVEDAGLNDSGPDGYENQFDPKMDDFDGPKKEETKSDNDADGVSKKENDDSTKHRRLKRRFDDDYPKSQYNSDDEYLNVKKSYISHKIISGDDLNSSFEVSGNPDTRVHNLFQDED